MESSGRPGSGLVLALLVAFASPVAAGSDDSELMANAKLHYELGAKAYRAGQYREAVRELKMAYLLKRLPPLLLNLGSAYEKLGDQENAIYYYRKFLAESPEDGPDRDEAKQKLAALKPGARVPPPRADKVAPPVEDRRAPPPVADPEPPSPPPPPTPAGDWKHEPLDEAAEGQPIEVKVKTPVVKGVKVLLHYRPAGEAAFTSLLMQRRGDVKQARIPGEDAVGKSLQYYIEARDEAGRLINNAGSAADPNIVILTRP
ncbi:MAG: hypothetical protein EXR72_18620 [Myxococcales bacterium]|nr:hypothetical protein [Myxococcales bacterium]